MTLTAQMIKPDIGLSEEQRKGVSSVLTQVLASEFTLYTKLRNFHWNVEGPQFLSLHEMFEEQYKQLEATIDEIAERIRTYGDNAIGTMSEFADHTRLTETPGSYPEARDMVMTLAEDHEQMVRNLREDIETVGGKYGDVGAEDMLTALLQDHQEMSWMLRTFIEGKPVHG